MPFALVLIGLAMIITSAKNTHMELAKQLTTDFTGEKNFTIWIAALGGVGAIGYVKTLEPISRLMLALVIIVMIIHNGGFFDKFLGALQEGPDAIPRPATGGAPAAPGGGPSSMTGTPADLNNPKAWTERLFGPDFAAAGRAGQTAQQNFQFLFQNLLPSFKHLLGIP